MNEIMKKDTGTSLDLMGDFSLQGLSEEAKQALCEKVQEAKLEIAKDAIQKKQDLQASSVDIDITINTANRLEQGRSDYHISSTHKTASGHTEVKVSRNANSGMLAVIVIIGIVLIIVLSKAL